ncbi:unnamed protein product [Caenorhabditis auriculariae]|uniref:EGF-like domain-containing protein n=1 Tax=Caenorhabditis auriculariae TaxID=2777116 RepID=A0A8S1HT57_9PELO|nr:unnamed protein product [Caenorhabditis auriculariae]
MNLKRILTEKIHTKCPQNTDDPPLGCTGYGYCYPSDRSTDGNGQTQCSDCVCPDDTTQVSNTECQGSTSCTPNPCPSAQYTCAVVNGAAVCSCAPGFTGTDCTMLTTDPCAVTPCLDHGTCTSSGSSYTCTCETGYYGNQCQYAGDPCASMACQHGGTCEMMFDDTSPVCNCPFNYYNTKCQTSRSMTTSYVGCYDDSSADFSNYYVYSTTGIKSGPACMDALEQYRIDNPNSVYNYSTMSGSTGKCLFSTVNTLTAAPSGGLLGGLLDAILQTCSYANVNSGMASVYFLKDLCATEPCGEANDWGQCVQTSSTAYVCVCAPDRTGATCETALPLTPCSGVDCGAGTCAVTDDGIGHYCICENTNQTESCVANPCAADTCLYGGTCVDHGDGTYTCLCLNLYTDTNCGVFEPCYINKCLNGGTCVSNYNILDSTFTCDCTVDWRGDLCEIERMPCDDEPCKNGGECENDRGPPKSFNCTCPSNWEGDDCTTDVDECAVFGPSLCGSKDKAAVCVNTDGSYHCSCSENWTGPRCTTNRIIYEILNATYGYVSDDDLEELTNQLTSDPTLVRDIIPFLIGGYSLETRMNLSWSLEDLFVWVAYEEKIVNLSENFHIWNDKVLGNCFTFNHFNSSSEYLARSPGYSGGLTMQMSVDQSEYLPWIDTAAIQVFISARDEVIASESPRFYVQPSFESRIGLQRTDFKRLGGKYGRCVKSVSEVKSYYYEGSYTTDGCLRSCYQDAVQKACGCMDPRYPMPWTAKSCTLPSKNCIDAMVAKRGDPSKWSECSCPLPCTQTQFTQRYSRLPYVVKPVECSHSHPANVSACIKDNAETVYLRIGLPTLQYQIYVETPAMDFSTFLSQLGGLLGVLMGISIISFIEVAFIIVHILVIVITKRSI